MDNLNQEQQTKVSIVMRQTNYDNSIAIEKLKEHDFDEMTVIREFMTDGLQNNKKPTDSNLSNNQKIFKSIREFF